MQSLKRLDLNTNDLTNTVSLSLGSLSDLQFLDLDENRFVSTTSESLCKLKNLTHFENFTYCPLSTSVHIEVALKFGGQEGMILEMDSSKGSDRGLYGMYCHGYLDMSRKMKCMFYVHRPINISSIRIIEIATNYDEIVSAITLFDNVISDNISTIKCIKLI